MAYITYRFVVGFVIPVYRSTRQIKRQFREMHERMQAQQQQQPTPEPEKKDQVGDYIEFEELK